MPTTISLSFTPIKNAVHSVWAPVRNAVWVPMRDFAYDLRPRTELDDKLDLLTTTLKYMSGDTELERQLVDLTVKLKSKCASGETEEYISDEYLSDEYVSNEAIYNEAISDKAINDEAIRTIKDIKIIKNEILSGQLKALSAKLEELNLTRNLLPFEEDLDNTNKIAEEIITMFNSDVLSYVNKLDQVLALSTADPGYLVNRKLLLDEAAPIFTNIEEKVKELTDNKCKKSPEDKETADNWKTAAVLIGSVALAIMSVSTLLISLPVASVWFVYDLHYKYKEKILDKAIQLFVQFNMLDTEIKKELDTHKSEHGEIETRKFKEKVAKSNEEAAKATAKAIAEAIAEAEEKAEAKAAKAIAEAIAEAEAKTAKAIAETEAKTAKAIAETEAKAAKAIAETEAKLQSTTEQLQNQGQQINLLNDSLQDMRRFVAMLHDGTINESWNSLRNTLNPKNGPPSN